MSSLTFKERATIESAVKLGCLSPEEALQLKQQNSELAAQIEAYRATLEYFVSDEFEWNDPHDSMIGDIHKLLEFPPVQCLLEVKADAGRDGFIEGVYWVTSCEFPISKTIAANQYAKKIREGKP